MADWLCWHVGTVSDAKFTAVARRATVTKPVVLALWAYILERAKVSEEMGTFGKVDSEDAAITLEITEEQVDFVLAAMMAKGLIAEGKIVNWIKRQHSASSTERVRAFRERQKQLSNDETVSETFRNAGNGTGQDRTGQDRHTGHNPKEANGDKNGTAQPSDRNGKSIELNLPRASRAFPGNGRAYSKQEKHDAWVQKMMRYMRVHWSTDTATETVRLFFSEDAAEKYRGVALFDQADAEYKSRKAEGTLQPMDQV